MAKFFIDNIVVVYFFYGLSFFTMGLAIFVEAYHSSELDFSRALRPLAGFGIVHGGHEWLEMFLLIYPAFAQASTHAWIAPLRMILLSASFLMLVVFGVRLISGSSYPRQRWRILALVVSVWLFGLVVVINTVPDNGDLWVAVDVYTRYALAIPGAALTVWGLVLQRQKFIEMGMPRFGRDVVVAAIAFGLYGGIGQLFASPSSIFPSTYLNAEMFIDWFGFPIQVFRACMATVAAVSIIRSLRAFEVEAHHRVEALRDAQRAERRRLEATRAELLHRTVKAQESERQRIARELHDETGQTLTALGLGLRGLAATIPTNPERAIQQAQHLEGVATNGLDGLQRLVSGLHPPQLDDLGLLAALRWYANEIKKSYGLPVTLAVEGTPHNLTPETRTVLFRIAQEAITNAIRHAQATQVCINLVFQPGALRMLVQDDGRGFDVAGVMKPGAARPCWGLLGIQERASLIGGDCRIVSQPGQGSLIEVCLTGLEATHDDAHN